MLIMSSIKAKRKKTIKSTKKEKKPRVSPKSGETELESPVYDVSGKEVSSVKLAPEIFNVKMNHNLIYQVATSQMANRRKVIAHTKDRSEVRGGGRKPWRQKGTGRARHGSIRSPLWRGGGVTFGPTKARVFKKEIPKKMRRLAFFMVISAKAKNNFLILLDELKIEKPKTKLMDEIIKNLKLKIKNFGDGSVLIALPEMDKNLILATRNLANVETIQAKDLNALDLLSFKYLLMPKETIKVIKETFKK